MKKKLVIFSEESVFSGLVKCGVAEVVDSLAFSLVDKYEVIVVCKEGNSNPAKKMAVFNEIAPGVLSGQFLQVNYYFISSSCWPQSAYQLIDKLCPDILHNFDNPFLLSRLQNKPKCTIYTFDDLEYLRDKTSSLKDYNFITTFSKGYSKAIFSLSNQIVEALRETNFKEVTLGIATEIFNPEKGLLIPHPYSKDNFFGKHLCKKRLAEKLNIDEQDCIFLFMARLIEEKGIDKIIKALPIINKHKVKLLIIGKGEEKYECFFNSLPKDNNVIYIQKHFFPAQALSPLAGADFYLQPSLMESGGLMPMTASQYGTIPIVTQNGGLADNFNDHNAIIVKEDMSTSILQALELYNNKEALKEKRKIVMSQEYGWNIRKEEFIKMYEAI